MKRQPLTTAGGAVTAAFASALCCAGPLLAVSAGLSGAGLASTFEPARPYLLGATGLLLGAAHYQLYRENQDACEPGKPCAAPAIRSRNRWLVWTATVIALVFASYPRWSVFILN